MALLVLPLRRAASSLARGGTCAGPRVPPACPPCERVPPPECRARLPPGRRGTRVVCCAPAPGTRPPCARPAPAAPLTCRDVGDQDCVSPRPQACVPNMQPSVNPPSGWVCNQDPVALRLQVARSVRRAHYEQEVAQRAAAPPPRPCRPALYVLGGERECARATDGCTYAVLPECAAPPARCGPGRTPPLPRCVELAPDDGCRIRGDMHLDPCAHRPRVMIQIERSASQSMCPASPPSPCPAPGSTPGPTPCPASNPTPYLAPGPTPCPTTGPAPYPAPCPASGPTPWPTPGPAPSSAPYPAPCPASGPTPWPTPCPAPSPAPYPAPCPAPGLAPWHAPFPAPGPAPYPAPCPAPGLAPWHAPFPTPGPAPCPAPCLAPGPALGPAPRRPPQRCRRLTIIERLRAHVPGCQSERHTHTSSALSIAKKSSESVSGGLEGVLRSKEQLKEAGLGRFVTDVGACPPRPEKPTGGRLELSVPPGTERVAVHVSLSRAAPLSPPPPPVARAAGNAPSSSSACDKFDPTPERRNPCLSINQIRKKWTGQYNQKSPRTQCEAAGYADTSPPAPLSGPAVPPRSEPRSTSTIPSNEPKTKTTRCSSSSAFMANTIVANS